MVKRLLILVVVLALILLVIPILFIPRGFVDGGNKMSIKASRAEIRFISSVLDRYKLENDTYPTTEQGLQALLEKPTIQPIPKDWKGPYLSDDINDPWNNPYQYRCPSQHNRPDFDLWSFGTDGKNGTEDDMTNWATFPETHIDSSIPAYFNIRVVITVFLLLFLLFLIFPRKKGSKSPPL